MIGAPVPDGASKPGLWTGLFLSLDSSVIAGGAYN